MELIAFDPLTERKSFLLIVVPFALFAWMIVFFLVPPFQTPDEPAHYAYVQSLYHWHYPDLPEKGEVYKPGIYDSEIIKEIRLAYRFNEIKAAQDKIFRFDPGNVDPAKSDDVDISLQAYHPPLYYFFASQIYRFGRALDLSPVKIYYATRITSLIFFLLFLVSFWVIIKTMWSDKVANYLTLAVSVQPTLLMVSSAINPEIASLAFFTSALGALLVVTKRGRISASSGILLALLSMAAFLSKFSGVVIIPIVFFGILLLPEIAWNKKNRFLSTYLALDIAALILMLVFNKIHLGSAVPSNISFLYPDAAPIASKLKGAFMVITDFAKSLLYFPGNYGWLDAPVFVELCLPYMGVFLTLIVFGAGYYIRREGGAIRFDDPRSLSLLAVGVIVMFMVLYSGMGLKYGLVHTLQPRYFLVALGPAMLLFLSGIQQILRRRHVENIAKWIFTISVFYFLMSLLFTLIPRFYV